MTRAARLHARGLSGPMLRVGRGALILALSQPVLGCVSYSYVDRENVRHRVGLMHVVVRNDTSKPIEVDRMTVLGVAIGRDPVHGGGVTIGYRDDRVIRLPDNACVDIKAPAACAAAAKPKGSVP
ncbi:MAG: hypothetical protein AB1542_16730 [Pseudomonadota bacterium]